MNPIRASVERPYIVAVGVILVVLFSVLALRTIPVQLKPTVDKPVIVVSTDYRGASAIEVESQVTRPIEDVLQAVEGVTEMSSESSEGRSAITLEYEYGTNTQLAVIDVVNKLSRVQGLPAEADESEVEIGAGNTQHVMWIALRSHYDANRVRRIVEDDVESKLLRIEGVSDLLIVGGEEREVQVRVDPDALAGFGISFEELGRALSRGNLNVRGGTIEAGSRQLVVRTVGLAAQPAELDEIIVREGERGSVKLGDVATVVDTHRETSGFVSMKGVPGVAIGVARKSGANVVDLIRDVDATAESLNGVFASRGLDVRLEGVYRETTYINAAMDFVWGNVWEGSLLSVLVLIAVLRSFRSVLIISLSIPISLIAVFLVMKGLGRTLNVISLAGIAFASGVVVDNAIVVLENVFRHMQLGKPVREAAIDGGREVWGGVLGQTLTTVAVFIPVLLQSDEASALFVDIAIAISAATILSLAVAFSVVPVLCALMLKDASSTGELLKTGVAFGAFGRWYARLMDRVTARGAMGAKLGFVLVLAAVSLASIRITPPAEYLPTGNQNLVFFFASPIPGTKPEQVRDNFRPLEEFILAQPETRESFAVTGPMFNGGGVVLKDEFADHKTLADFHTRLYGPSATLAGFQFVVPVRASLFEDPGKQFEIELSGPDFDVLERASQELQGRLMAVQGVQFVRSSLVTGRPELRVSIDEHKAKDLGLTVESVGQVVETAVAGRRWTALIEGGRDVDVNVLVPPERIDSAEELAALRFVTPDGRLVSLGAVATIEHTTGPQSVRRLERERNVLLTVNIAPDAPLSSVVDEVERNVFPPAAASLGAAYTLKVGGTADKMKATLKSLSSGFGLSVLIIYLLMVALFASWSAPFVILTTVPLALTGGLIGIRVAHDWSGGQANFDVISMLGFIILAGLVVNNAILIIHQANNFRAEGMDRRRALAESASTRLRPIFMTVVTTIVGAIPLAMGGGSGAELYQGLGAIIVGGLTVSTIFTLVLVPVLLSLGYDVADWFAERRAVRRGHAEGEPASA